MYNRWMIIFLGWSLALTAFDFDGNNSQDPPAPQHNAENLVDYFIEHAKFKIHVSPREHRVHVLEGPFKNASYKYPGNQNILGFQLRGTTLILDGKEFLLRLPKDSAN